MQKIQAVFATIEAKNLDFITLPVLAQNWPLNRHCAKCQATNRERWILTRQKQLLNCKYFHVVFTVSEELNISIPVSLRRKLYSKKWVVNATQPFDGSAQVIEYLGRYSHKVAISNHRIKKVTATEVSFGYKDYRQNGWKKVMTLKHLEFVRRFAQHILPKRFVRIRHYGILSSNWKRGKLQNLQRALGIKRPQQGTFKTKLRKCPCCKHGNLITLKVFGERGPPKDYLSVSLKSPVA